MKPGALVALLKKARTRLVVLDGSESLVLATELLPVTHVIAARDLVSAKAMAQWVETFYRTLTTEPLASACEDGDASQPGADEALRPQRRAPMV